MLGAGFVFMKESMTNKPHEASQYAISILCMNKHLHLNWVILYSVCVCVRTYNKVIPTTCVYILKPALSS